VGGGAVRLLESVGPLVAVKPADHLRFGGRRGRGRIAFFPVGWGGPDSGGVLWPAVRRCSPRPGYHGCAGPGAMMTVRARAAGVLIAVVLAAAAAGCTGDVQQVPASSAPAPATPGTSKGRCHRRVEPAQAVWRIERRGAISCWPRWWPRINPGARPRWPSTVRSCGPVPAAWPTWSRKTPLTTATRFDIASVSKQFTATAILLLSFDGALTPAGPGVPVRARAARVGGSGHPGPVDPPHQRHPRLRPAVHDLRDQLPDADHPTGRDPGDRRHDRTHAPPGATFEYSNSNYVLLAEVAAAASGTSLPDLLRRRVFDPLG